MGLRVSIRAKVFILLAGALLVTLFASVYLATQLMVRDKASYLFEANLIQAREAVRELESRVLSLQLGLRALGPVMLRPEGEAQAAQIVARHVKDNGLQGVWAGGRFNRGFGPAPDVARTAAERLGWDWDSADHRFESHVASIGGSKFAVGVAVDDGASRPVGILAVFDLSLKSLQLGERRLEVRLLDSAGRLLLKSSNLGSEGPNDADFAGLSKELLASTFPEGVREWSAGGVDFIAAYAADPVNGFRAVTFVPKSEAMQASRVLATKLAIFGGSLLLVALGLALLLSGELTRRIRQVWLATQQVARGDFEVRAAMARSRFPDETDDLGKSFDAMAGKIAELLIETAEKARMEQEIETAQLVQSRYFPAKGFEHANLAIDGRFLSASECGGDWWNFVELGDQVMLLVGDATGHGVQAALITAAAHGAVSMMHDELLAEPNAEARIRRVLTRLDRVVRAAGGGQSTMTFVATVFDLKTGEVTSANASHPPIYVQPGEAGGAQLALMGARYSPLGDDVGAIEEFERHTLAPGDSIVICTDGVLEPRATDGKRFSKGDLLRAIRETAREGGASGLMEHLLRFFDEGTESGTAQPRPDDITVIVVRVPVTASFARSKAKSAA